MISNAADNETSQVAATGHSAPAAKLQRLSDILQRDHDEQGVESTRTTAEASATTANSSSMENRGFSVRCMKSRGRSLLKKIFRSFQSLHNKVSLECRCRSDESRLNFRVVEPTRLSIRSSSRKAEAGGSRIIRLGTMNVALFSLAPALPGRFSCSLQPHSTGSEGFNPSTPPPLASFLIEQPLSPPPSDEIEIPSTPRSFSSRRTNPAFSLNPFYSFHSSPCTDFGGKQTSMRQSKSSILEVLRESKADLIALQEVRAEEERGMAPLADLAEALGMHYAYAESWAPEFGNAVLSRWPIKNTAVKKIHDSSDCRNLLRVVIDVPAVGEIEFCCTHLDHLDEDWRLKQVASILEQMKKHPHFLAGDLNSLTRSDYSEDRWNAITKMRLQCGKAAPRSDVMEKLLNEKHYKDACTAAAAASLDFSKAAAAAVPHGQEVQGTCKYGTRVDYILGSSQVPYSFVPGSYKVWPSKGTSDHHLITVDVRHRKRSIVDFR